MTTQTRRLEVEAAAYSDAVDVRIMRTIRAQPEAFVAGTNQANIVVNLIGGIHPDRPRDATVILDTWDWEAIAARETREHDVSVIPYVWFETVTGTEQTADFLNFDSWLTPLAVRADENTGSFGSSPEGGDLGLAGFDPDTPSYHIGQRFELGYQWYGMAVYREWMAATGPDKNAETVMTWPDGPVYYIPGTIQGHLVNGKTTPILSFGWSRPNSPNLWADATDTAITVYADEDHTSETVIVTADYTLTDWRPLAGL